jgi:hypothetical protein
LDELGRKIQLFDISQMLLPELSGTNAFHPDRFLRPISAA